VDASITEADQAATAAQAAKSKSARMFQQKQAIEALQDAGVASSEVLVSLAGSQKHLFENQQALSNLIRELTGYALGSIANTRHSGCSARSSTNAVTPTTPPAIKQVDRAKPRAHEEPPRFPGRFKSCTKQQDTVPGRPQASISDTDTRHQGRPSTARPTSRFSSPTVRRQQLVIFD